MGRSYMYECPRCGYKAAVAGGAARGHDFHTQTILCRECQKIYDAVTRLRVSKPPAFNTPMTLRRALASRRKAPEAPPRFESVLNRLPLQDAARARWVQYPLRCPVSSLHQVRIWKNPGICPRCGVFLDRSGLPYRTWD